MPAEGGGSGLDVWPPHVNCVGDCTRKAAVSGAPGGGRHVEGTHCTDTVINCWPYFLRTLEAGACAPAWLAVCYVQLLLAAWREAFKLLGICSRPTSPLPPGQGAGDGGKLWSGCLSPEFISPLGHALGRARGGAETGWDRPLLGLDGPVDVFPLPRDWVFPPSRQDRPSLDSYTVEVGGGPTRA